MSDIPETLAKRLDEIESQVAFQDELIESLNAIVARQDHEIVELKHRLGRMAERLKEIADTSPGAVQDEVPPHY